jgi:hypothetical protein
VEDISGTSHGWRDMPPALMGAASSDGQQSSTSTTNTFDEQSPKYDLNASHSSHKVNSSNDIVAAAVLLQNRHGIQYRSPMTLAEPSNLFQETKQLHTSAPTQLYTASSNAAEVRFGSDLAFGTANAFNASLGRQSSRTGPDEPSLIDSFESHHSTAANTRPASPSQVQLAPPPPASGGMLSSQDFVAPILDLDAQSPKIQLNEESLNVRCSTKRRASSNIVRSATPEVVKVISKRRKSTASSTHKPSRENLTDDQKRENHIRSEQRRRTLIKIGFDDLGKLVPGLRNDGGPLSKSTVLEKAAIYLETILEGNHKLKLRLEHLKRNTVGEASQD